MTDRIIELPPLPDHWEPSLTAFVLNWGKAAIEADRQRWSNPATQPAEPVKALNDDEESTQNFYDIALEAGANLRYSFDGDEIVGITFETTVFESYSSSLIGRYGHPATPEGWQLVPKEPTEEMLIAAMEVSLLGRPAIDDDSYVRSIIDASLESAPKYGENE